MKRSFLIILGIIGIFFIGNKAISIIMTDESKDGFSKSTKTVPVIRPVKPEDLKIEFLKPEETLNRKSILGRKLFFDPILSKTGKVSCASCHKPDHGFADDKPVSLGINDLKGDRNSPTIYGAKNLKLLFWDGRAMSLEEQALGPIQNPVEMGETLPGVLAKLNKDENYKKQFSEAFGKGEITKEKLASAIAEFERTQISLDSDYDRYIAGDTKALSSSAKRGLDLFKGKAMCIECHKGPDFTDGDFHNIGLPITDDVGRAKISVTGKDTRKFKTPTLREVEKTGPYFHTGQFDSLEGVIAFYNAGGVEYTYNDPLKKPLNLTMEEQNDLIAFLKSLTGRQKPPLQ